VKKTSASRERAREMKRDDEERTDFSSETAVFFLIWRREKVQRGRMESALRSKEPSTSRG